MSEPLQPSAGALLVVDMQQAFVAHCANPDSLIATVVTLVNRARLARVPVVWTRHSAPPELEIGDEDWQIIDELAPEPGDPIVEKLTASAFAGTDLHDTLRSLGVGQLWVCGVASDTAVLATCWAALERGFRVTLAQDAHATSDSEFDGAPLPAEQLVAMVNLVVDNARLTPAASQGVAVAEGAARPAADLIFPDPDPDDDELIAAADAEDVAEDLADNES